MDDERRYPAVRRRSGMWWICLIDLQRHWQWLHSAVTGRPSLVVSLVLFVCFSVPASLSLKYLGTTTPIWISNAIAVATILRSARPAWPGLVIIVVLADYVSNMFFGDGPKIGLGVTACDATEVSLAAVFLQRISRVAPLFSSIGQISRFTLVCTLVPAATAAGGAILLALGEDLPLVESWVNWYLGAMFGMMVLLPFLLMWTDSSEMLGITHWAKCEVVGLACLVGLVCYVDFNSRAIPGLFLCFPFLLLAAFRGGLLGATTAAVVLAAVASSLTLSNRGLIAEMPGTDVAGHLVMLQLYLAVVLLSSLPVAVMLEQRKLLSAAATLSELSRMARHDVLTGLPNRVLFQERLAWMQAQADRSGSHTALLLFDLDRFKPVNDLHGHAAGDQLLKLVADRVRATVRATDTVARLGGDEFAIVGNTNDAEAAQFIAQHVIAALGKPFEFGGLTVQIGCSIGIAFSTGSGTDPELLVQRADAALYRAKAEGRNCFRFFEPGMDVKIRERAELETELRAAIKGNELVPYYQPIVMLNNAQLVGFEILARWTHNTLGEISPGVFVPVAEGAGLIGTLTEQLLRRACCAALTWPDHLFITVNISPVQLRDRSLPNLVRSILAETGFPAERLEVELTESALIDDFQLALEILLDFKVTGVRLTLDDFGTGYSSLRHLQGLPLDKIKIDMGFVRSMTTVVASRKIVAGVIGLGHSLGLPVVAEGVEDATIAEALNLMGCDLGQGWLYGRAMAAEKVDAMLLQLASADAEPVVKTVEDDAAARFA